jgi:hypothetical protein
MLRTTDLWRRRSSMAPAIMGSSLKTLPQEAGSGTGSLSRKGPACWVFGSWAGIRVFQGVTSHC